MYIVYLQMQIYIEKMIQEKASLILTQYRSRLKRSRTTSPDNEQCRPPKYQIVENPAPAAAPPVSAADRIIGNPSFPMTAISLTGEDENQVEINKTLFFNIHIFQF